MAFYLMIGSRGSVIPYKDAQYFQSLEAAKASVRYSECALIVESGIALEEHVHYDWEKVHFYTRECGWFQHEEIPDSVNPYFCGQTWILGG